MTRLERKVADTEHTDRAVLKLLHAELYAVLREVTRLSAQRFHRWRSLDGHEGYKQACDDLRAKLKERLG